MFYQIFYHKLLESVKSKKKYLMGSIFIFLFSLWLIFVLINIQDAEPPFFTTSYDHYKENIGYFKEAALTHKETVSGRFQAKENNLQSVSFRIKNISTVNAEALLFKIKESDEPNWLNQRKYHSPQFRNMQWYSFLFPLRERSKDKYYNFEIESLGGIQGLGVVVEKEKSVFFSSYNVDRFALLQDRDKFLSFLSRKVVDLNRSPDFTSSLIINSLPLALYSIWYLLLRKYISFQLPVIPKPQFSPYQVTIIFRLPLVKLSLLKTSLPSLKLSLASLKLPLASLKLPLVRLLSIEYPTIYVTLTYPLAFFTVLYLLLDMFFIEKPNDFVFTLIAILWLFVIRLYKFESRISLIFALLFLGLCPLLLGLNLNKIAEKAAVWAYLFLVSGILHRLWELRTGNEGQLQLRPFLKGILQDLKHPVEVVR